MVGRDGFEPSTIALKVRSILIQTLSNNVYIPVFLMVHRIRLSVKLFGIV